MTKGTDAQEPNLDFFGATVPAENNDNASAQAPVVDDAGPADEQTPAEQSPVAPKADENTAIVTELARKYLEQQNPKAEAPKPFVAPTYNLGVPDQLAGLLHSEDIAERNKGLGMFASAIANTVQAQMLNLIETHYAEQFNSRVESMLQERLVAQQQAAAAERSAEMYYQKFPQLNNDAGKQLSAAIAQQLLQQEQAKTGKPGVVTPALLDQVGKMALAAVGQLTGKPVKPAGQFQARPGARPNVQQQPQEDAFANEVMQLAI